MKKFIMAIVFGLCILITSFADYNTIKKRSENLMNGDYTYLEWAIHKEDIAVSTIVLSYKESDCSQISIYIDIETECASEQYNEFDKMGLEEFKNYIYNDFANNAKYKNYDNMNLYKYDSENNMYIVHYSWVGK